MRRLIILPLLLLSLTVFADKWYIATAANGGDDADGDGSITSPWLTLKHAADTITGAAFVGDTIVVGEGTFTETAITSLGVGVSIWGAGDASHIVYTYANSTYTNACLQLVSATENTNGSQSISYVKIDGSSGTAYHGILVRCRSNVTVDNVTMVDFKYNGINFHGSDGYGEPSAAYATGNKLSNCTITNCSAKVYELNTNGDGQVRISGQDGIEISDNIMDNTTAGAGYCANNIDFKAGYNKNMDIYGNKSYKPATNGTDWNIHFESWDGMGGNHLYDNEFWGGGMQMDIGGHFNVVGSSAYSWLVENNYFGNTTQQTYVGTETLSTGLAIEGDSRDVIVRYNHFENLGKGIGMNAQEYTPTNVYDVIGVRVYYNIFENCGYVNQNSWVIELCSESTTVVIEDIYIDNNTMVNTTSYPADAALFIMPKGTMSNIRLRNNIIQGMDIAPIYLYDYTGQVSNLYNQNNCLYNNGNSDLIKYYETPEVINYTVENTVSTAPSFKSQSTYRLNPTSPCIDAGIDVGLDYDYYGHKITGTPDIGAMEYGRYTMKTANKTYR